jgi:DNA helicase-2/ATP-dependent DNA helicase PcrA
MSTPTKVRLSPQQISVVSHVDGPLLVVAGPGSGKTRVLTERIRTLINNVPGHFRVLALTFTNKAAEEMRERLADLGEAKQRMFIGTLHSFCTEMLAERGKLVGVTGMPNIFEQFKDRKEILLKAIEDDPLLKEEIGQEPDAKARGRRVDGWLQTISRIKAHPISCARLDDELDQEVLDAYDAGLRSCNAYDFDDLLLLAYRLLSSNPKLADFYRRLYKYVCIDEAQDLNEAQYAVLCALCGDSFTNVLMVGDPKQSIYGFNTSSPEYMDRFRDEFGAKVIDLTENFRSSKAVVEVARALDHKYMVAAQLPIAGDKQLLVGNDEDDEARLIVDELQRLFKEGHPDVEGGIQPSKCAILGRTRFALLAVETKLQERKIPFYKRLTANHENESEAVDDFQLALRVVANPKDRLHFAAIAKKWKVTEPTGSPDPMVVLDSMAKSSPEVGDRSRAVVKAIESVVRNSARFDLMPAFQVLKKYADGLDENDRRAIYEDVTVFQQEWDQYLRSEGSAHTIAGFMSSKALGATQKASCDGVALLTVHSSKGLEFDVVFVAGMAEGTFPDYRATEGRELQEESRNAFVAVTRSKRLLYLTYPQNRQMPWGDSRRQMPSRFLTEAKMIAR